MALHTRTPYSRLIVVHGTSVELRYRHESWVQFASRRIAPRVDLAPLAAELNAADPGAAWIFEGVDRITPRLYRDAPGATLPVDHVVQRISNRSGPVPLRGIRMEVRTSRENRRTLSSQVYLKERAENQPLGERNDEWTAEADRLEHGAQITGTCDYVHDVGFREFAAGQA